MEKDALAFIDDSSPIGKLIKTHNWYDHVLGPPQLWPNSLKYTLSNLLGSEAPSFLCWGSEKVFLYNDAFTLLFSNLEQNWAQPNCIGTLFEHDHQRVQHAITQAWNDKRSLVKHVTLSMAGRYGNRFADISVGVIKDLDGSIRGVVGICHETTSGLVASDILRASHQHFRNLLGDAPIGICVITAEPFKITEINDEFRRLLAAQGQSATQLQQHLQQLLGELKSYLKEEATTYLKEVPLTTISNATGSTTFVDLMVTPFRNRKGQIEGLTIVAVEVTDRVAAHDNLYQVNEELASANEELAASNEELQTTNEELALSQRELHASLHQLTEREQQISEMVATAPFPIAVYVGREMRIVEANQAIIDVWGKGSDIMGKTYFEVLPELQNQDVYPQLLRVFDTGEPFHARNQRIDLKVHGVMQSFYFNYSFTPLHDTQGKIYGLMNTAADVTDLYQAKQQVEASEANFRNMILQAPVAMCLLLGKEYRISLANQAMLEIWGRDEEKVIGLPVFDALPDARAQGLEEAMNGVINTGQPFYAYEQPVSLIRHGQQDVVYQNFVYQPYKDGQGRIIGILAISVNVTEQVNARREVENAFSQLRLAKEAADLGTFDFKVAEKQLGWDQRCRQLFGISHQRELDYHNDFLIRLHPNDVKRVQETIAGVTSNPNGDGNYEIEYRVIGQEDGKTRWIRAKGRALFDAEGKAVRIIGLAADITQNKQAELHARQAAQRQARLAAIVKSSDDIIVSKDLKGTITSWNPAAERMFGYSAAEAIGKHISLIIPPDRLKEEDFIISQIRAGKNVDHFDTVRLSKNGSQLQLSITVSPIIDEQGIIIGASKIARDISSQLAAKHAAERYTNRLEALNGIIKAVSEELDLKRILQKVTDASTALIGADYGAFFYNHTDEKGDSYLLYTLTGASRDDFEKLGMPRDTALFHPTFAGEDVTRIGDVRNDPRYGHNSPHHGLPEGHLPVVSYLAVPVISRSGKVIGGLFFAHQLPNKFTDEHEELVVSIAGQAAIGIDNAMLYEKVKELNDKKDEFISLASHELKTPLASINGYLQILDRMVKEQGLQKFLAKATLQVKKLTALVNDLLDVSKIEAGKLKLTIGHFDMIPMIEDAIELVRNTTDRYQIIFEQTPTSCMVEGDGQRIEQVVINLLSNAIKYSPGTNRVEVSLIERDGKAVVGIKDYGLGIAADKMGNLFSRFYHIDDATPNISGLGIGLYLSHEIIQRHHGEIWVDSKIGEGSTFWFSLPLAINPLANESLA
jgi:PAS domain S-box-containing protein